MGKHGQKRNKCGDDKIATWSVEGAREEGKWADGLGQWSSHGQGEDAVGLPLNFKQTDAL
jgi:hypothetical protein